jgi:ferric-dicitrate binding protein FerR (iron transport regulator)
VRRLEVLSAFRFASAPAIAAPRRVQRRSQASSRIAAQAAVRELQPDGIISQERQEVVGFLQDQRHVGCLRGFVLMQAVHDYCSYRPLCVLNAPTKIPLHSAALTALITVR